MRAVDPAVPSAELELRDRRVVLDRVERSVELLGVDAVPNDLGGGSHWMSSVLVIPVDCRLGDALARQVRPSRGLADVVGVGGLDEQEARLVVGHEDRSKEPDGASLGRQLGRRVAQTLGSGRDLRAVHLRDVQLD